MKFFLQIDDEMILSQIFFCVIVDCWEVIKCESAKVLYEKFLILYVAIMSQSYALSHYPKNARLHQRWSTPQSANYQTFWFLLFCCYLIKYRLSQN